MSHFGINLGQRVEDSEMFTNIWLSSKGLIRKEIKQLQGQGKPFSSTSLSGPFKCYLTQWGVGGIRISYRCLWSNNISTRECEYRTFRKIVRGMECLNGTFSPKTQ